jgi:hypothetical protein
MEYDKYIADRARELAECRTDDQVNYIIKQVEADIQRSRLTNLQETALWSDLRKQYEEEPKPFEKAISGRSLNQLQAAVQQFLRNKSGN